MMFTFNVSVHKYAQRKSKDTFSAVTNIYTKMDSIKDIFAKLQKLVFSLKKIVHV